MRIGVIGGTFDPIHLGHLIIAEEARERLALEEVVFIPTGQPWLKANRPVSPGDWRLEMARLAMSGNPFFRVSAAELERPGPSYSVETLEQMHRELGPGADIYFILGLDALKEFHRWKEPQRILDLCTLAAVTRPGHSDFDFASLEEIANGASHKVIFLDGPEIGISGTEIRRRVAQGVSIRYWVPPGVEKYIRQRGLYRSPEAGQ